MNYVRKRCSPPQKVMKLGRVLPCGPAPLCYSAAQGYARLQQQRTAQPGKAKRDTWRSEGILLCLLLFFSQKGACVLPIFKAFHSKNTDSEKCKFPDEFDESLWLEKLFFPKELGT